MQNDLRAYVYKRMQILHAYKQLGMVGGLGSVGLLAQLHAQRL